MWLGRDNGRRCDHQRRHLRADGDHDVSYTLELNALKLTDQNVSAERPTRSVAARTRTPRLAPVQSASPGARFLLTGKQGDADTPFSVPAFTVHNGYCVVTMTAPPMGTACRFLVFGSSVHVRRRFRDLAHHNRGGDNSTWDSAGHGPGVLHRAPRSCWRGVSNVATEPI